MNETTSSVDTRRAPDFRTMHFDTIDECLAEVQRIVVADHIGTLQAAGNWAPGQVLAHVAAWAEYGYVGYPIGSPPFFIHWILRWQLPNTLKNGMPRGVRIPGVKTGTTGMDKMSTAEASDRLRKVFDRLKNYEVAPFDSPAFGPMSHEDRIRLNLRHAELHLGYLNY